MAITIAIPCQPNFWQYRTSVYRKFGTVMVIDFTKPKVWYGNWYKGFGTVTVPNPPLCVCVFGFKPKPHFFHPKPFYS